MEAQDSDSTVVSTKQKLKVLPSDSSPPHSDENSEGHINLSPPARKKMEAQDKQQRASDSDSTAVSTKQKLKVLFSDSSPAHSDVNSEGHINLSPPGRSPEGTPARSSVSSDRTTLTHGSSPREDKVPASPPEIPSRKPPESVPAPMEGVVNVSVSEESTAVSTKTDPDKRDGKSVEETGGGGGGGGVGSGSGRLRLRPELSILRRTKREKMVRKAALGFRVFGFLFCLISLSIMVANRNQGWALDSFERYKEFRYCVSVNAIGFLYSGAQALDLSFNLATGKYTQYQQHRRYFFDFALDQIIAYLLISASSSATARIDDWKSNWGKDKFPDMATASVSMSFLAFVALAASSLVSGYALCTSKSM